MTPLKNLRLLAVLLCALAAPHLSAEKIEYLQNGKIRVGVDLDSGGGVCYFGRMPGRKNLLNRWDKGRLIQQSYYGTVDGSQWLGKPWRWNPVQGGDCKNNPSEILDWKKGANSLYVKTRPRHWGTGELLKDVTMEETVTLEGEVMKIRFSCTYAGAQAHPVTHQELPAVFLDGALDTLYFYAGDRPWTGGALTAKQPGFPNEYFDITEGWAAYADRKGWGVGVYVPGVRQITAYRYAGQGRTGSEGDACSYFAPLRSFAFDKPMTFSYTAYVALGTLDEMRARFQKIKEAADPADAAVWTARETPAPAANPSQKP